jgi:hypothetical protein
MFILVIVFNALASTGVLSPLDVGEISDKYPTFFTPASNAFSIWGLIYALHAAFIIYQWTPAGRADVRIDRGLSWLPAANYLFNASWIIAFVNEELVLSCIFMAALLFSLIWISNRAHLNYWPQSWQRWPEMPGVLAGAHGPRNWQFWLVAPAWSIYFGWIAVASIANVALTCVAEIPSTRDPTAGNLAGSAYMQAIATVIAALMLNVKGDVFYASVLVWATNWIAVEQVAYPRVVMAARTCQLITGLLVAATLIQLAVAHYRSRGDQEPFGPTKDVDSVETGAGSRRRSTRTRRSNRV